VRLAFGYGITRMRTILQLDLTSSQSDPIKRDKTDTLALLTDHHQSVSERVVKGYYYHSHYHCY